MSYGYTEHICSDCGDRYVTDYANATGHTYTDIVVEATEDGHGYTRHLCIVCNYSYLSDFVTSGDDGYIEEEEPKPIHKHDYELHVQNFEVDKYFIALRVCICGDSKVGGLDIQLTNAEGETMLLVPNEYGQADYAAIYGDWLVTVNDENGEQLAMFDLLAGAAPEVPEEPETPDKGEDVETPGEDEAPDEPSDTEQPVNPDDGKDEPENPDDGSDGEMPEEPDETEGDGSSVTAIILLIVFVLLVAGGIGAVIFLKKRKNKNQN